VSWIHLDDVCRIFIKAINDETMRGAYNGVAGDAITNNMLTQKIAQTINRPLWAPSIPHWLLRIGLGEMASLVTGGNNISSKKIKASGYTFQYPTIESALKNTLVTTKVKNE
jgi:NAD dependent epimerase/dehydratase family enzyme